MKYLPEVWETREFDDILLQHCNAVYNQNTIDRWTKGCILPFHKKSDLRIAKNYHGITLTSIAAKIYNALLYNCIEPKIEKILRKNQNGFRGNRSMISQILMICQILEGVRAKNLGNYTRMLQAILNKSWKQHPTKQQMYGHLLSITKTIQVRQTRHAGHCWRSKDELISNILLWTPSHGRAKLDDQLEPIYNSSVPIQDIALKTYWCCILAFDSAKNAIPR